MLYALIIHIFPSVVNIFLILLIIDIFPQRGYYIHMEFIEMETKEDILALSDIERAIAPEIMGEAAEEYLLNIEHNVRYDSEAGAEYYLVYSGGAVGFFALHNEGLTVTVDKVGVIAPRRRQGVLRRIIAFIRQTYDPTLLRVTSHGRECPALERLGFALSGDYYEMRYE